MSMLLVYFWLSLILGYNVYEKELWDKISCNIVIERKWMNNDLLEKNYQMPYDIVSYCKFILLLRTLFLYMLGIFPATKCQDMSRHNNHKLM